MTTNEPLFQAIRDNPEDETLRLIYADWLEEQADPISVARAEFMRLQCQLHRLKPQGLVKHPLYPRQQRLLHAFGRDWNGPLHEYLHRHGLVRLVKTRRGPIKPWIYRRGFVEGLHVRADMMLNHAELLFGLGPIRHLKVRVAKVFYLSLCPQLARLATLDLSGNRLTDADARDLADSPHLKNLRCLHAGGNAFSAQGRRILNRLSAQVDFNVGGSDLFASAARV